MSELPQYSPRELGDLGGIPHGEVIGHVNDTHEHTLRRREELGVSLEQEEKREEQRLLGQMEDARKRLETRGAKHALQEVRSKIYTADLESVEAHQVSAVDIVARRLSKFGMLDIASDMDNTITDMSKGDYLIGNIPASKFAEAHLAQHGRESFPTAFVRHWQPHLRSHPILFYNGGRNKDVVLRDGVDQFADHAQKRGWGFQVVSANFEPFVHGVLSKTRLQHVVSKIHSIKADNINATDKETVLKAEAVANPNAGRVFIGDGSSDLEAVKANDYIIAYFALEGSSFARELAEAAKRNPIVYFTYRTYTDIQNQLDEIDTRARELAKAA